MRFPKSAPIHKVFRLRSPSALMVGKPRQKCPKTTAKKAPEKLTDKKSMADIKCLDSLEDWLSQSKVLLIAVNKIPPIIGAIFKNQLTSF